MINKNEGYFKSLFIIIKMDAVIICDDRERNGAIDNMENATIANNVKCGKLSYLGGGGEIGYQVSRCEIGDYIISIPSKYDSDHFITAIVIERKTWEDLAASIADNRSKSQHNRMVDYSAQTGCLVYYIIEGKESSSGRIPLKKLKAKIRQNCLRGYPFLYSKNVNDTANLLLLLTRDILKLYRKGEVGFPLQEPRQDKFDLDDFKILFEKYGDSALAEDISNLLNRVEIMCSPWERSEPLDVKLTQRQKKSNDEIEMNMWGAFTGVGPKTANLLSQHYTVRQMFTNPPSKEEVGKLKYESGSKISKTTINKIFKSHGDHKSHARILSQIPGITMKVAKFILCHVEMSALWVGDCDANELKATEGQIDGKTVKIGNRITKILSFTCPDYRQPLPLLDKDDLLYKALVEFGDPQELRYYIKNIEIQGDIIRFDAYDESYEYSEHIILGRNELKFGKK